MYQDLSATADYEILYVGSPTLVTSTSSLTQQISSGMRREYIQGQMESGVATYRKDDDYPTTLSGLSNMYPGLINGGYSGTGLVNSYLINSFRDLNTKVDERGQYVKIRKSQLDDVLSARLIASHLPSSSCDVSAGNLGGLVCYSYSSLDHPTRIKIQDIDFEYLFQHTFNPLDVIVPTLQSSLTSSSAPGQYYNS